MPLRPYQQRAFSAVVEHIKYCFDPCLVEAATGAGKSHIIAAVAEWIYKETGKKILITAPNSTLVTQNHSKYPGEASIFCATAGRKELDNHVVFGSPQTILNSIDEFDNQFCSVIIDEGDGLTNTLRSLIINLRKKNPNLRVIGFTATPYRMRTGYIYQYDLDNKAQEDAIEPYYTKLVCQIKAPELINLGFLSKPLMQIPKAISYDTSGLIKTNLGFTKESLDAVYIGQGRKTASIVAEVIELSKTLHSVMFFAQNIYHAKEILDSLPPDGSRMITSKTKGNKKTIQDFKDEKFKYMVNVNILTVGFDCPSVEVIAILRPTDSARLLQQIIGRGLRLCPEINKKYCLILDYANNIERHELEDDLFDPKIKTWKAKESIPLDVTCPICGNIAQFGFRSDRDYKDFKVNENGYFVDLMGGVIQGDYGPIPAHYGRRCIAGRMNSDGHFDRCEYRWTFKECEHCKAENDIAARRCYECKKELVNPNDKLRLDFKRMKKNPKIMSTDKVVTWSCVEHATSNGKLKVKAIFRTQYRSVPVWLSPDLHYKWKQLCVACEIEASTVREFLVHFAMDRCVMPKTITSVRSGDFFRINDYNLEEDVEP